MIVREMAQSDVGVVAGLERLCFAECWGLAQVEAELDKNPYSHGWLLVDSGEVVAYAFLWEMFETALLARIGVHPRYQGNGYGKLLLDWLERRGRSQNCEFLRLEVRPSNRRAISLYENNGYVLVNTIKNYYSNGESALVMTKAL